jgi:hypothetical protein
MPQLDIDSATATDLTNQITDYSVDTEQTDAPDGQAEFEWQMTNFSEYLGYYKNIPELQTAIDAKVKWTVGAGYLAEEPTVMLLDGIKGTGKDTFLNILKNMDTIRTLAGDSFAEIIRDKDDVLVNLKPIDPSTIVIISNKKGQIVRYEQREKVKNEVKRIATFQPDEMFHLRRKRIADEVHGISIIPTVEKIILMRNEAMSDWKRVLHRNVEPLFIYHLDTDDTTEIATFKATMDAARKNGENLYVPKGVVVPELVATAQNSSLNPLQWINQLNDYFFQAVNVPQIIIGNSKEFTDASSKIAYLSFEQSVKEEQLYLEEEILSQLNLEVKFVFPASLQNELISGQPPNTEIEQKPEENAAEPNDVKAEAEGE